MKIVNFILNFFINNHLSKLDINADGVGLILVLALIYSDYNEFKQYNEEII